MKAFSIRALHQPLMAAGLVPPDCRLMSIAIGTDGAMVITYEVFVSPEQLERLGAVFVDVGRAMQRPPADDSEA